MMLILTSAENVLAARKCSSYLMQIIMQLPTNLFQTFKLNGKHRHRHMYLSNTQAQMPPYPSTEHRRHDYEYDNILSAKLCFATRHNKRYLMSSGFISSKIAYYNNTNIIISYFHILKLHLRRLFNSILCVAKILYFQNRHEVPSM